MVGSKLTKMIIHHYDFSKLYTREFGLFRDFKTENDRSFYRMMSVLEDNGLPLVSSSTLSCGDPNSSLVISNTDHLVHV